MKWKPILTVCAIAALTASCNEEDISVPSERPIYEDKFLMGEIRGTVTDALLKNADITVTEWVDGQCSNEVLATAKTDTNGDYSVTLEAKDSFVCITARNGNYIEEASGQNVRMTPGQQLRAIIRYEEGEAIDLQVTPLTHWASCQAEWRAKNGANDTDAINLSYDVFSNLVSVPIREVKPSNMTLIEDATSTLNDAHRYGAFLAGISSLTAEMSENLGVEPHTIDAYTSIAFSQIACNDVRSDGKLDGVGYINGSSGLFGLSFGTTPIEPKTYQSELARNIIKMAKSDANVSGLTTSDFLTYAEGLAANTSAVFGSTVEKGYVDIEPPVIDIKNLTPNQLVAGNIDIDVAIFDDVGVKDVRLVVLGYDVSISDKANPTFKLNTADYSNGDYEIKIVATDQLDNVGEKVINLKIDNSAPIVNMLSDTQINYTDYQASGTWSTNNADIDKIYVNGQQATVLPDGTWSADISLISGFNNISVYGIDVLGNTSQSINYVVAVDLVKPSFEQIAAPVKYSDFTGSYENCFSGSLTTLESDTICVPDNRVSLDGLTPTHDRLANNAIPYLSFSAFDHEGAGVYSESVSVQYAYIRGVMDYRLELDPKYQAATWRNLESLENYYGGIEERPRYNIPFTVEYLGQEWLENISSQNHNIFVKITDERGNETVKWFKMKFEPFLMDVGVIALVTDKNSIFSDVDFNTRDKLHTTREVVYSYENKSPFPVSFELSFGQSGGLVNTVGSVIKEAYIIRSQRKAVFMPYSASIYSSEAVELDCTFPQPEPPVTSTLLSQVEERVYTSITENQSLPLKPQPGRVFILRDGNGVYRYNMLTKNTSPSLYSKYPYNPSVNSINDYGTTADLRGWSRVLNPETASGQYQIPTSRQCYKYVDNPDGSYTRGIIDNINFNNYSRFEKIYETIAYKSGYPRTTHKSEDFVTQAIDAYVSVSDEHSNLITNYVIPPFTKVYFKRGVKYSGAKLFSNPAYFDEGQHTYTAEIKTDISVKVDLDLDAMVSVKINDATYSGYDPKQVVYDEQIISKTLQ